MRDIWNKDRKQWESMPLLQKIESLRLWFVIPEPAFSENWVSDILNLSETLAEAVAEMKKANQFRDEVLAALIECQDCDRLRKRLMELIERTAKPC